MDQISHLPDGTTLQNGKYRIMRFIGAGGFGCTYEASFALPGARVAIKEFFPHDYCNRDSSGSVFIAANDQTEFVHKLGRKFLDEARTLYKNRGLKGVVKVIDVFEENDSCYFAMDYIEGQSLKSLIKSRGSLPEADALRIIAKVGMSLQDVHNHNLLHLDIKPENIMLGADGEPVLIDFGVSKQYTKEDGCSTSTLAGCTPGYAPIEQTKGNVSVFKPATDIYALGATLYAMLTGMQPPDASSLLNDEETLAFPQNVSEATSRAVAAAMQPKVKDRPNTVQSFLSLLPIGAMAMQAADNRIDAGRYRLVSIQPQEAAPYNPCLLPGAKLQGGKYEIIRVIHHNDLTTIYEARLDILGESVAIKEFYPTHFYKRAANGDLKLDYYSQYQTDFVRDLQGKFEEDAKRMFDCNDIEGMVKATDLFREHNTSYLTMDYIDGPCLKDFVAGGRPMAEADAVKVARSAGSVIEKLHARGCMHLNVGPEEIRIAKDGSPVVLAPSYLKYYYNKYWEDDSEGFHFMLGEEMDSPGPYSALRQKDVPFLPTIDVYALGGTIYMLVTGLKPKSFYERIEGANLEYPTPISSVTYNALQSALSISMKKRATIREFLDMLPQGNRPQPQVNRHGMAPWKIVALLAVLGVIVCLCAWLYAELF